MTGTVKRRWAFSIHHGLAVSLALHSAFGLPLVAHGLMPAPDEPPTLVIELQGIVAQVQTAEQTAGSTPENATAQQAQPEQQARPQQQAQAAPVEPAPPPPQEEAVIEDKNKNKAAVPAPADATPPLQPAAESAPAIPAAPQAAGVAEQMQLQQTIKRDRDLERDRLNAYVKLLTRKVQTNLVYPDEGRRSGLHGTATVSFTIRGDGQIRLESLKIVESSGQRALDTSALQTIRASAPFEPPPREITISIAVAFGRKS